MEKEIIIEEVKRIIKKYISNDCKIFLFGSLAKGNALDTSDIDVGIYGKEKISWDIMVKILQEVDIIKTLRKIDIVDFNTTEENFRENVLKHAKAL